MAVFRGSKGARAGVLSMHGASSRNTSSGLLPGYRCCVHGLARKQGKELIRGDMYFIAPRHQFKSHPALSDYGF